MVCSVQPLPLCPLTPLSPSLPTFLFQCQFSRCSNKLFEREKTVRWYVLGTTTVSPHFLASNTCLFSKQQSVDKTYISQERRNYKSVTHILTRKKLYCYSRHIPRYSSINFIRSQPISLTPEKSTSRLLLLATNICQSATKCIMLNT